MELAWHYINTFLSFPNTKWRRKIHNLAKENAGASLWTWYWQNICVGRSHVMFYLLGDIVFLFFCWFFFFKPLGMGGADGSLICLLPTTWKNSPPTHTAPYHWAPQIKSFPPSLCVMVYRLSVFSLTSVIEGGRFFLRSTKFVLKFCKGPQRSCWMLSRLTSTKKFACPSESQSSPFQGDVEE